MQRSDNVRPIIIKRKKVVVGGGHHGGAWKVAYADFVTAMMAFFLMLWLLGSVTDDKRKGIADYFSETYAIQSHSSGGDGVMGGVSLSLEDSLTDKIATRERHLTETSALEALAEVLQEIAAQDADLAEAFNQAVVRLSDEGLVVELFDLEDSALFDGQTDLPRPVLQLLVSIVADVFATVANPVAITVHSRSFPSVILDNPVWPLTVTRAQALHAMMQTAGLPDHRFRRVTGHADRAPADPQPMAARNNRVELILLRVVDRP